MNYDVDYFIKKFGNTKDNLWCAYSLHNGYGRACANGWCGSTFDKKTDEVLFINTTEESRALQPIFAHLSSSINNDANSHSYSNIAAVINNGDDPRYQQPTPKQRILAALRDIKKLQQPTITEVQTVGEFIPVTFTEIKELQSSN